MRKHIYVNGNFEIVQDNFEKVIEKYMGQDACNYYIEEREIIDNEGDDHELMADGYFQMINNSINEVSDIIEYINDTNRLDRKKIVQRLSDLLNTLENY